MRRRTALSIVPLFFCFIFIASLHHSVHAYSYNIGHVGYERERLKSRRNFIIATASTSILHPLLVPLADQHVYAAKEHYMSTTKEIAQYIKRNTNQNFLRSVVESNYNFLYRGLSPNASYKQLVTENNGGLVIIDEPFDLLDVETYGSDAASTFFQSLEVQMNANRSSIRPSNSHIGSTCPTEAARWGTAVSIWPLGEEGVQFAWLERGLFWPVSSSESSAIAQSDGTGLSETLRRDAWEIMFRADNGFLAVSAALDDELKQILKE